MSDQEESVGSPARSIFTTSSGKERIKLPNLVKSKLTKIIESVPADAIPRRKKSETTKMSNVLNQRFRF